MKQFTCVTVTVVTLAWLFTAVASHAMEETPKIKFLLDLGAIQVSARAVHKSVAARQWKTLSGHISGLTKTERRAGAYPGMTPEQKQWMGEMHQDVLRLQAAGQARDFAQADAAAQEISADATAVVAHAGRLPPRTTPTMNDPIGAQ